MHRAKRGWFMPESYVLHGVCVVGRRGCVYMGNSFSRSMSLSPGVRSVANEVELWIE